MKRTALYISSALLLIVGLCISCQKEQNFSEENGASVNEVIVKATISGAATKVSFKEDGTNNKLKAAWDNDDRIIGWDAEGNAIELEIAGIEENGTAIFKTVQSSAAIPSSGKVYMIYAPGKGKSDISEKSLVYDLSNQADGKLPALMTATGTVSNNVLSLEFTNRLAIVAVKNPTFPVTEATAITGLKLSGSNIQTKATFSMDGETLKMESSVAKDITRACSFTTAADGTTTETMVYFAVLPNATAADVTVSTTSPTGYQISFTDKSFEAGQCYLLNQKTIGKQTFAITVADGITGGSIATDPSGSVAWGTEVTITPKPSAGYELIPNSIAVTGTTSGNIPKNNNKFNMPQENVTVSGSFQKKDYTITATGDESSGTYSVTGGTYTVKNSSGDPVTTAQMDDVIIVTPVPAAGYSRGTAIVKETTSGNTVPVISNAFTMPAANVTVTVIFSPPDPEYVEMNMGQNSTYKLKWATYNLGASTIAGDYTTCYGYLYQWGSVETLYTGFPWTSATAGTFTWKPDINQYGFVKENLTYTDSADLSDGTNDVVRYHYPFTSWRMPTSQEFLDLYLACGGPYDSWVGDIKPYAITLGDNTTTERGVYWCSNYDGVAGALFIDKDGNKLFFPAAGYADGNEIKVLDTSGTSAICAYFSTDNGATRSHGSFTAMSLFGCSMYVQPMCYNILTFHGGSIRPVSNCE